MSAKTQACAVIPCPACDPEAAARAVGVPQRGPFTSVPGVVVKRSNQISQGAVVASEPHTLAEGSNPSPASLAVDAEPARGSGTTTTAGTTASTATLPSARFVYGNPW